MDPAQDKGAQCSRPFGAKDVTVGRRRCCDRRSLGRCAGPGHTGAMERSASTLLGTLSSLRWLALLGQSAAILVATGPLALAFDARPLWLSVAALGVFNLFAMLRVHAGGEPSPAETFAHIAVDVGVLAWLIAWSGGAANPFTSLFLLPIVFAALALPVRWTWAVAALCALGYLLATVFGQPLPHRHGAGDGFDLHLAGMAVNFLVSVAALLYFFTAMLAALRRREHELSLLRERFARNEGIVALATHAASVAHELNTPLGTMTLMLDDLIDDGHGTAIDDDHRTLRALVDVCRDRVRELAVPAADRSEGGSMQVEVDRVIARWQLVRPAIALVRSGNLDGATRVDAAVGHLLMALLNNAADAGEATATPRVDLRLDIGHGALHGEIRDYGAGFDDAPAFLPSRGFGSSKPHGLGVGLALSHATVERMHGELSMHQSDGKGVCVRFRLPLGEHAEASP